MFTGIIEEKGKILRIEKLGQSARFTLEIPFQNFSLGESIGVNGCCLTVSEFSGNEVQFDVLSQTLRVTALGELSVGDIVNLERAMQANARVGGHFVLGHVDGVGVVKSYESIGQDHRWEVEIPQNLIKYCIDKGSIAVDGMSLTIAELKETSAVFWITPHTHEATNLLMCAPGKKVNLEVDMLAKYVERLMNK